MKTVSFNKLWSSFYIIPADVHCAIARPNKFPLNIWCWLSFVNFKGAFQLQMCHYNCVLVDDCISNGLFFVCFCTVVVTNSPPPCI